MWIKIKNDIFDNEEIKKISFLLGVIFDKPTNSKNNKAKPYVDIDSIRESESFLKLDNIDRQLLEDSWMQFYYENDNKIKIVISNEENCYNLEEGIVFLQQPLWIILENSTNDSNFIKSIIHHFDNEDKFVIDCLNNRWIQFANAGGSGAKNQIKGELSSFDVLCAKHNSISKKYYRGFVLVDSDNDYHGQGIKEDYSKLLEFLNLSDIEWHILEKRAMENYMPDQVLFDIRSKKNTSLRPDDRACVDWINVYEYLSHVEKDFLKYNGQAPFENLHSSAKDVYKNQSKHNYEILKTGISYRDNNSHGITDDERRFKNAFPKLFLTSPFVNKNTLEERCNSNELKDIYNKIKDLL